MGGRDKSGGEDPSSSSLCFTSVMTDTFAICLADVRVERVFKRLKHQHNAMSEFRLNGTEGNYIKIPSRNLYQGWYRT